jgi:hypothetical protein
MKKNMLGIAVLSLLAMAIAAAPISGFAQETKKEAPKVEKKQGPIPFNGKIAAVDKVAKTIKVGERTFQITSETKLMKGGKPATLDNAVVGEVIGGNYQKGADGKLNAKTVRLGPKPEAGVEAKGKGDAKKLEK